MAPNELGLMYPIILQWVQAKVIKLFILMDVDTQARITTRTRAPTPSYLAHHTPLLNPKHTNTPPDWAGNEEGSQYLKSSSYLALAVEADYRVFYNAALSSLTSSATGGFNTSPHLKEKSILTVIRLGKHKLLLSVHQGSLMLLSV